MNLNDLYSAARNGDRRAEEKLFDVLTARFRLFSRQRIWDSDVSEEVVQESLLTIYKEYKTITFTSSFAAWAYKVLNNRILAQIKKGQRQASRLQPLPEGDTTVAPASEDFDPALKRRLLDCLKKIRSTNLRYARILNLQYQGFDTEDVCRRLAVTRSNLYSLLSRARTVLELCLEEGGVL
ncbi:MAG: RNA polymerase sigma factor [candidate division Zixibacteria bacterium]|nr:RNA polymerase sigma factor [candidate division Zixibacteria bacterium]MDH3936421.1 RNA polymerase sigma factor [candidate division Zixibacteria bacterium]